MSNLEKVLFDTSPFDEINLLKIDYTFLRMKFSFKFEISQGSNNCSAYETKE